MESIQVRTAARKPLNLTVPNTSVMILPPVLGHPSLNLSAIAVWQAGHAYVYGDYVRHGKNFYWCVTVAGGNSGATPPTHADGDATDGTLLWRKMHYGRNAVTLTNTASAGRICICRGNAAEDLHGIVLAPYGSHNEGFGGPMPYDGPWYAISDGSRVLAISEG